MCSCHFRGGKERGPEVFQRNADKLFAPVDSPKPKKRQKKEPAASTTTSSEADNADLHVRPVPVSTCTNNEHTGLKVDNVLLNVQLEQTTQELNELKKTITYQRERYSLQSMSDDVICMETGLPNKTILGIIINYVKRFEDSIVYFAGWKVEALTLEDQVFVTLMKLRQNYTNLHLAQLFHCSTSTIRNIVITFIHVLYKLLFEDAMKNVPS